MAEVTLTVGGYHYQVACRDGEEDHLHRLGSMVDGKAGEARAAVGNASEVRQLLLAALLLADDATASEDAPNALADGIAHALEQLATRAEAIAERVEKLAAGT